MSGKGGKRTFVTRLLRLGIGLRARSESEFDLTFEKAELATKENVVFGIMPIQAVIRL